MSRDVKGTVLARRILAVYFLAFFVSTGVKTFELPVETRVDIFVRQELISRYVCPLISNEFIAQHSIGRYSAKMRLTQNIYILLKELQNKFYCAVT